MLSPRIATGHHISIARLRGALITTRLGIALPWERQSGNFLDICIYHTYTDKKGSIVMVDKLKDAISYAYTSGALFGSVFALAVTFGGFVTLSLIHKGVFDPYVSGLVWAAGAIVIGLFAKTAVINDATRIYYEQISLGV